MKDARNGTGASARPWLILATLAAMLIAALVLRMNERRFGVATVTVGGIAVRAEVAETPAARERGLSGRSGLGEGEGMLFRFATPDIYVFWMKDMRFPIDIIWISGGRVADITENAMPPEDGTLPQYYPKFPVDAVLEVRAGFARAHGIAPGSPVAVSVDGSTAPLSVNPEPVERVDK